MRMPQPADHEGLHNCKNDNEWKRPHPYFNLLIEEREMAMDGSAGDPKTDPAAQTNGLQANGTCTKIDQGQVNNTTSMAKDLRPQWKM